jgi:hypothetical protein
MSKKERGRKWDGRSRPPSDLYKKKKEKLKKEDQEYLDSLKEKL